MKHLSTYSTLLATALFTFSSCEKDDEIDFNFPDEGSMAYVSSNTSGMITTLDVDDVSDISMKQKNIASTDADGIYYNDDRDEIILASRTYNRLEIYQKRKNGSLEIKTTSSSDFSNAREIAVSGDMIVVAQDADPVLNNNMNRFYVYERTPSGIRYRNMYDVNINLWGIHAEGNTLYAVVDNSSDIVSFENFFSNLNGMIEPSKRVTVEGIVRTHGITHSSKDNRMGLTDVGDGAVDNDGAVVVISNFSSMFGNTANGGTIMAADQVRIEGSNTMLGNPVDVAYNEDNKHIYVAERASEGGKVLIFEMPASNGNPTPAYSKNVAGAAAIYLHQ
ncbi:hypothetical protein PKOR_09555 [Pontibacter korlensis]|uniref:Lipoprotein n=1 Tax=Pontibacter korlensis TaxID=400092 RepID=A0A0E3ZHL9_9BACT|nr:hypothetical protein [Pontibacter korlensis]AKD05620.1 hypothetical protein PKOR_09555 [Pontibacter korlensis]